mmetsp:Transcript_42017/g.101248  ORF Transcript_42017/g.101248 Transcript_42017/m.101248 type:complete len:157 (-) Transcript_42017:185-655(-)
MQTFEEWAMNTVFGTYAWNASPVDGTNVQRAFGATGQHFKFPLDNTAISLSDARSKNRISRGSSGQATMEHIDTMFPLFWRQKELLKALYPRRHRYGPKASPIECLRRNSSKASIESKRTIQSNRKGVRRLVLPQFKNYGTKKPNQQQTHQTKRKT